LYSRSTCRSSITCSEHGLGACSLVLLCSLAWFTAGPSAGP
jgi:hypothetical protein